MTYHDLQSGMANLGYMASDDLAVSIHLALTLGRPLLLEGAAGVGKTEVALVLAEMHDTCLLYTSPSPRDLSTSRMPSSA